MPTTTSRTLTIVRYCGRPATAYAERVGDRIAVRVYDEIAGHYVEAESLTPGQRRYVIGRTLDKR